MENENYKKIIHFVENSPLENTNLSEYVEKYKNIIATITPNPELIQMAKYGHMFEVQTELSYDVIKFMEYFYEFKIIYHRQNNDNTCIIFTDNRPLVDKILILENEIRWRSISWRSFNE